MAHACGTYIHNEGRGPHSNQAGNHEEDFEHEIRCLSSKADLGLHVHTLYERRKHNGMNRADQTAREHALSFRSDLVSFHNSSDPLQIHQLQKSGISQQPRQP